MALQSIVGPLLPRPVINGAAIPTFSSILLDASAEKLAFGFRVPKTGTLDEIEWRGGTVTVNAASQIRTSFQDVLTTGPDPDGTQDQFRDIAGSAMVANGWNIPGLMTSDGTDGGVKRSVTRGQLLASVIEFSTFTASDVLNISTFSSGSSVVINEVADDVYTNHFTAAWAVASVAPIFALKYDDGTYEYVAGTYIANALNTVTYNSGSTPDERGLAFQFPVPVKVGGMWLRVDLDGDADVVLYQGLTSPSTLETVSLDKDQRRALTGNNRYVRFSTDISLLANTDYVVALKPTSVTSLSLYEYDVNTAAILGASEGGQNLRSATRTDAGNFTATTTKRPWMGLHITALDDGVGGGGGGMLVHPGMAGGLRG